MNITLELPISVAKRLEKLGEEKLFQFFNKKLLTVGVHLCYYLDVSKDRKELEMPSMHRCDTRRVVFRIEIELATQLQKYASEHARSINDILRDFIQDLVKDVELTAQDYLDIAAEVARNVEKRKESGIR